MRQSPDRGIVEKLERLADGLLVVLFLLIFGLVLAQIVCRYILNDPLVWSEELARIAFVWVATLAWSLGSRHRSHIAVTMFVDALPLRPRLILAILVQMAVVLFCALLVVHGWTLTGRNLDLPTVTLDVPYAVVYAVVPLGGLIVALYAAAEIRRLAAALRGPDEAHP